MDGVTNPPEAGTRQFVQRDRLALATPFVE